MEYLIDTFFAHPLFYIGALFAFAGAMGFLIYLRGFIGGIGNVFTMAGHVEHVEHANVRAVWGLAILTTTFVVWEIFRLITGWFI